MKKANRSWSDRAFTFLMKLFPFDFRRDFESEMEGIFREQRLDIAQEGRRLSMLRLWWETLVGIARTAPREHWDMLRQDSRFALQMIRKNLGFTTVAVFTLALGIGATTTIFSAVNGVLLQPLPYEDPSQLVLLGTTWGDPRPTTTSVPDFIDWKNRLTTVRLLAASQSTSLVLTGEGEPLRIEAARISPDFLPVLGIEPVLGRSFSEEEHRSEAEGVVMLSHGLWQRNWGGDPGVLGTTLRGEGSSGTGTFRIVGVMPPEFQAPAAMRAQDAEIWMPLEVDGPAYATDRSSRSLRVIGRLRAGVSLETARQEVDALARAMAAEYPDVNRLKDQTLGIGIARLLEATVGSRRGELWIVLGAAGFLLLIACANIANLLLARATGRDKEVALRTALGAGRNRIVRQLLTESVFLAGLGGIAGIGVAFVGVKAFRLLGPEDFPRAAEVAVDLRVLGFAAGLAVITGVLSGLAPAVLGSKTHLSDTLKDGTGKVTFRRNRTRIRHMLVTSEMALALVLLAGAGLLLNSYMRLQGVDPGFDSDDLLVTRVSLGSSYSTDAERAEFFRELAERIEVIPGVQSVSAVADPPIGGVMWAAGVRIEPLDGGELPAIPTHLVLPHYFRTMRIRLLEGRTFTRQDDASRPEAAVVNESMARRLWPDEDPLGKRIKLSPSPDAPWWTVVGVVNDIRQDNMASQNDMEFYIPFAQNAWYGRMYFMVRTTYGAQTLAGPIRQAIWDIDPNLPFDGIRTMNERVAVSLAAPRFRAFLLTSFAAVALLLAAVGIYGMMLYVVGQRTHEVGIRVALGATSSDVLKLVLRQGMALTMMGIVVGLAGTFALSRVLTGFLYGVTATDLSTFAAVSIALGGVALLACAVPARRAGRVDPIAALRSE